MANAWDITDAVLQTWLTFIWDNSLLGTDCNVHLFKNDYTPAPGMVSADLDEADFDGYTPFAFAGNSWGAPSVTDHIAISVSTVAAEYTASGTATSQTIYGYYFTDAVSDALLWAERFEAPRTVEADYVLLVTPEMRMATYPASS